MTESTLQYICRYPKVLSVQLWEGFLEIRDDGHELSGNGVRVFS